MFLESQSSTVPIIIRCVVKYSQPGTDLALGILNSTWEFWIVSCVISTIFWESSPDLSASITSSIKVVQWHSPVFCAMNYNSRSVLYMSLFISYVRRVCIAIWSTSCHMLNVILICPVDQYFT